MVLGLSGLHWGQCWDLWQAPLSTRQEARCGIFRTGGDNKRTFFAVSLDCGGDGMRIKKLDGIMSDSILSGTFGRASAQEAMLMLRDILKQTIPVRDVATQIKTDSISQVAACSFSL